MWSKCNMKVTPMLTYLGNQGNLKNFVSEVRFSSYLNYKHLSVCTYINMLILPLYHFFMLNFMQHKP